MTQIHKTEGHYIPPPERDPLQDTPKIAQSGKASQSGDLLHVGDTQSTYTGSTLGRFPQQEILNKQLPEHPTIPPSSGNAEVGAPGGGGKVNAWFSSNMMVALFENLSEMAKTAKLNRILELSVQIQAMITQYASSKDVANMRLDIGRSEQTQALLDAATGLVTAATSVGQATLGGLAVYGKGGADTNRYKFLITGGGAQAMAGAVNGLNTALTNFMKSGVVMDKATAEACKELADTIKQFQSQLVQSAAKAFEENEDILKKALELLQSIFSQNAKAFNNFTPHV